MSVNESFPFAPVGEYVRQRAISYSAAIAFRCRFLRSRFDSGLPLDDLPENSALTTVPRAIAAAHRLYNGPGCEFLNESLSHYCLDSHAYFLLSSVVVFVVQVGERNVMDQRMIEFELWESHGVPAVRLTLGEVRMSNCFRLKSLSSMCPVYHRCLQRVG